MSLNKNKWIGIFLACLLWACGEDKKSTPQQVTNPPQRIKLKAAPQFSVDSAWQYIEKQLSFGSRVPGTQGHEKCGKWIAAQLESRGAKVIIQKTVVKRFDEIEMPVKNIIGVFNPEIKKRVLLSAHWDTRFSADAGEGTERKSVPGANDGGSGVGALLEIARLISQRAPAVGIDIIFWDTEDQGSEDSPDTWCKGSQYWAKNPHVPGYIASYGINLDMVAGKNTWFPQEQVSVYFAKSTVDKVWETANALGYSSYFPFQVMGPVTDDHLYVNQHNGTPTIDIIARDVEGKGFFAHWHTIEDDMNSLDTAVLKAVGQTVVQVIYNEE